MPLPLLLLLLLCLPPHKRMPEVPVLMMMSESLVIGGDRGDRTHDSERLMIVRHTQRQQSCTAAVVGRTWCL